MKNYISNVFILSLTVFFLSLTGCENFLNSKGLKDEISQAVDYASKPDVILKINVNNLHGTLTGETGGVYKLGVEKNLSFVPANDYQFCCWKVYNEKDEETGCAKSDEIYIKDKDNLTTTFTILKNVSGYKIVAYCELRPAITVASPQFQALGVNRDRAIILNYNMNIALDNFRYNEQEVAELKAAGNIVDDYKDSEGRIYGYCSPKGIVYYKNIKIRNANDITENLINYFEAPEVSGSKLIIAPKKGNANNFDLDANGLKDINLIISNQVANNGIKMYENYDYTYRVSSTTDEQSIVTFNSNINYGNLVYSGTGKYSVGEEIKLTFTESDAYKFIGFDIEDSDNEIAGAAVTSCFYEEAKGIAQVVITVMEGNRNINVKLICAPRPIVKTSLPAYTVVGANFDSNIVIEFGAPVSENCFIYSEEEVAKYNSITTNEADDDSSSFIVRMDPENKESPIIAVDIAGERYFKNISIVDSKNHNISLHYNRVELSEDKKMLTIYFDKYRLFDFEGEATKDIYVTLNPSVYSIFTKKDLTEEKVFINNKSTPAEFSYRVRKTSETKANITFDAMDNKTTMGVLNYSGQKSFNLGETFTVIFEPTEAYGFIKWIVSGNEEGNLVVSENGTELNCTVAGGCDGITISPFCEKLNLSTIFFTSTVGSVSPSGYVDYRRNAKIPLVSTTSGSFCFTKWKVEHTITKEIYSDEKAAQYFKFENSNAAITTVTVLQDSANLSIIATAEARPHVFTTTPNGLSNQVDRDSNIRVFMDKGLSEESLYYTNDEVTAFETKGYKILYENESSKLKPYGYYLAENDLSSYVFKNIKISDNSDGTNYLKFYGCPYLGDSTGKVLIIPVKKTMENGFVDTTEGKNLPGNREILVELGTEYGFYSDDDVLVNLENVNLTWAYKTNENFDTTKPILKNTLTIKGVNVDGNCTYTKAGTVPASLKSDEEWYKNRLVKKSADGSVPITLNVTATDEKANLQSVTLVAQKVVDSDYNTKGTVEISKFTLPIAISGPDGTFNGTINLIDKKTLGLDDGLYKVYFELLDQVGNKTETDRDPLSLYYYYLLIDTTPPKDSGNLKFLINNGKVQVFNLNSNFTNEKDYYSHSVTLGGNVKSYSDNNTFSSLTNGVDIPLNVTTNDIFGNTKTYTYQLNAGAKPGMYMYEDRTFSIEYYDEKPVYGIVIASDYTNIKAVTKPVYIAADCSAYYSWSLRNVVSKNSTATNTLNNTTVLDLPTINELYKIYEYREKLKNCGGADFSENSNEKFTYTFQDGTTREFGVRSSITMYNNYLAYGYDTFSGTFYYSKDRGQAEKDTRGEGYILFNSSTGSHIYKKTYDGKNLFYTNTSAGYDNSMYGIFNIKLIASYIDN